MQNRCPSADFVCKAVLQEFALGFTRKSTKRGCGVADILPKAGAQVWGAVFKMDDLDLSRLDLSEGYRPGRERNAYKRTELQVCRDGDKEKRLTVWTYDVVTKEGFIPPSRDYLNLILKGADECHLPLAYIEVLRRIKVADEPEAVV